MMSDLTKLMKFTLKSGRVVISFTKSSNSRVAFIALFLHKRDVRNVMSIIQHPVVPNTEITARPVYIGITETKQIL